MFECLFCNRSAQWKSALCRECEMSFHLCMNPRVSEEEILFGFPIYSATQYRDAARKWLIELKTKAPFRQNKYLNTWVPKFARHWSTELKALKPQVVVAIPSNPWRTLHERALSVFLGESVAQSLAIPFEPSLLTMNTASLLLTWPQQEQKNKNRSQRFLSATQKYDCLKSLNASREFLRILLVDDVCTTGATLKASARSLEKMGHKVVGAFVLSKVGRPN